MHLLNVQDLRTRVEASTDIWALRDQHRSSSAAQQVHAHLLGLLGSRGDSFVRDRRASRELRRRLITELNRITTDWIARGSAALSELIDSRCALIDEREDYEGTRTLARMELGSFPTYESAARALTLANSLFKLPPEQHRFIFDWHNAVTDIRNCRVVLRYAREDGGVQGEAEILTKLDIAQAEVAKLRELMSSAAAKWIDENAAAMSWIQITYRDLPILVPVSAKQDHLFEAGRILEGFTHSLVRPLPLDSQSGPSSLKRWAKLWAACEECSGCLSVLSVWLRCLGSGDDFFRCDNCYRHLGEGLKKKCAVHRRTAKIKHPRREGYVSTLFRDLWLRRSRLPSLSRILSDFAPPRRIDPVFIEAAREQGLPSELQQAAASLAAMLHPLRVTLGQRVCTLIERHFEASLIMAKTLFETPATSSETADRLVMDRTRARKLLTWEIFFAKLFCLSANSDIAVGLGKGRPIDIDHPLAVGEVISPGKVAMDLAQLDAWITVDTNLDAHAYLDSNRLARERSKAEPGTGRPPTLEELGRRYGVSAQAISQALNRSATRNRRRRVIPMQLAALQLELSSG